MKRLVIDQKVCLKAGQCYYLQPKVFKADEEGWPVALVEHPEGELLEAAEEAIEICPSGAISLEDE